MDLTKIATTRLFSQQIAAPKFTTVKKIVGWMGALQAQDYEMVKWAVGVRLPNATEREVDDAINRGEIIRTHLLRPTWHLVSADDVYWLLALTSPHIKAKLKSRQKSLGLTGDIISKSFVVLENALREGVKLPFDELEAMLAGAGIATGDNRAYHLLVLAELDGIVCSGATQAGKPTYALLEERVPKTQPLVKEEALARLAERYFFSHGPATLRDFIWWAGLPVGDAKRAIEITKSDLISETIGSQTFWLAESASSAKTEHEFVCLLPAFDEFIIGYNDRSASLPDKNFSKAVSSNGVFRPVIVVDGQVVGLWKRVVRKDKVVLETEMFKHLEKSTMTAVGNAAAQLGKFLEKKIELRYT